MKNKNVYRYKDYICLKYPLALEDRQKAMLDACILFVEEEYTLRPLSKITGIPTSTIWYFIHVGGLKSISRELYSDVIKQLNYNKKYKTGRHTK